jgi:DNA repair protein RadD
MAADRRGVMIFTSSIRHAQEILGLLPAGEASVVFGDTPGPERDEVVRAFKAREVKYLVNVSVLTTGFDAPHVDMIAVLRPTESVSLFQQIVGRGLRLAEGKTDCLVLDYTGQGHNVFRPEIADDKPADNAVPVTVVCPACAHENEFWGLVDGDGELLEHYGRKCRGATEDARTGAVVPCGFRFRFKRCERCGEENDVAARQCGACRSVLVDDDKRLKEAMALKDAHVMRPDSMMFEKAQDKNGCDRLEVWYFDADGKHLTEYFYLNTPSDHRAFYYNFARMHLRLPERDLQVGSADDAVARQHLFRLPAFVIARKKSYYWQVREKIFPD